VQSILPPSTLRLSRLFVRSVRLRQGCLRFPGLPARASHPLGSDRPSGIRASRHTRRLLRTRSAAWLGTRRGNDPSALPGSWIVPTWRLDEADARLPVPQALRTADDRTSIPPTQRAECVRSDPTAAWNSRMQPEYRLQTLDISRRARTTSHFLHLLCPLHFELSTFSGGPT